MLAIVLVIKLFQNKRRCFIVSQTQLNVTVGMGMSTCVVRVIVHFFLIDTVLICKFVIGYRRRRLLQETQRSLMNSQTVLE